MWNFLNFLWTVREPVQAVNCTDLFSLYDIWIYQIITNIPFVKINESIFPQIQLQKSKSSTFCVIFYLSRIYSLFRMHPFSESSSHSLLVIIWSLLKEIKNLDRDKCSWFTKCSRWKDVRDCVIIMRRGGVSIHRRGA